MYEKQMELFEEGGLKDEGGMVDEVSGNDVPVGSTRKEVRDDIPAMLSEGEFVFPADVVRYVGLENLMRIRQEAKQGLKQMEAMGQMGNGDEAVIPDDMPFGVMDLIIIDEPEEQEETDEPKEMAKGGVVQMNKGGLPSFTVPKFNPQQQDVRQYKNKAGNSLFVPFLGGKPVYPIPQGYFPASEATEETEEGLFEQSEDVTKIRDSGDGEGVDVAPTPTGPNISEMNAEELAEAAKGAQAAATFSNVMTLANPALGLASKAVIGLQNKAIENRAKELGIENPLGDKKETVLGKVFGSVVEDIKTAFTGKPKDSVPTAKPTPTGGTREPVVTPPVPSKVSTVTEEDGPSETETMMQQMEQRREREEEEARKQVEDIQNLAEQMEQAGTVPEGLTPVQAAAKGMESVTQPEKDPDFYDPRGESNDRGGPSAAEQAAQRSRESAQERGASADRGGEGVGTGSVGSGSDAKSGGLEGLGYIYKGGLMDKNKMATKPKPNKDRGIAARKKKK